jgi:hypothetical protein
MLARVANNDEGVTLIRREHMLLVPVTGCCLAAAEGQASSSATPLLHTAVRVWRCWATSQKQDLRFPAARAGQAAGCG